jgi:peptidoglycan/LPS O-acetylase OafA/YrhL
VLVFIIVSGFVITHLVTERPEPYGDYLLRRFMRIFPLFAVTCVIGFFTTNLCAETVSRSPWASDPSFAPVLQMFARWSHTIHEFFWPHVIAHITMLHGAISSNLLPDSPYAFNSPAWSISLEWQFYLIAPAAIMIARKQGAIIWFALLIALLEIAFRHGLFGQFDSPSFLPGAAGYFALGIASRLAYPAIAGRIRYPNTLIAVILTLVPFYLEAQSLWGWAIVMIGLALDKSVSSTSVFSKIYYHALESPAATYFGSRSYSVYLSHWPIITLCTWLWLRLFPTATSASTFVGVALLTIPLTLLISELLYRAVEQPGIMLGSRIVTVLRLRKPVYT